MASHAHRHSCKHEIQIRIIKFKKCICQGSRWEGTLRLWWTDADIGVGCRVGTCYGRSSIIQDIGNHCAKIEKNKETAQPYSLWILFKPKSKVRCSIGPGRGCQQEQLFCLFFIRRENETWIFSWLCQGHPDLEKDPTGSAVAHLTAEKSPELLVCVLLV